jgi:hypothetical protein
MKVTIQGEKVNYGKASEEIHHRSIELERSVVYQLPHGICQQR